MAGETTMIRRLKMGCFHVSCGLSHVSIHDGASHAMAWLGSALGMPQVAMGVDTFGQSGTIQDLYKIHDLDSGSIVNGALAALSLNV